MDNKEQTTLLTELRLDVKEILQRVSKVEVKASIFGAIGGALVVVAKMIMELLKR